MKNIIAVILISFFSFNVFAQETEMEKVKEEDENVSRGGFKKENLFTGGGIQLSFANSSFLAGASPVFGYSINKWLDAGIGLNFTYFSNRHIIYEYVGPNGERTGNYLISDDKQRRTVLAPLAFVKFYPVKFLFLQAQGEMNFISEKIIYPDESPTLKTNYNVPSLLLGVGYASGREGIGNFFYHISISMDVLKDKDSPYVEQISNGKVNALPIIRAGIQIPLFQGRR